MSSEITTGTLVLCKVGSFAPWPAVIFPQRFLRNDVYKKRKQNCVAVCFFNDPTYYWENPQKLRPLNGEIIKKFLTQDYKNTTQKDLIDAYKQAKNYVDLETFIRERFDDEGRIDEFKDEIVENGEVLSDEDPHIGKNDDKRNVKELEPLPEKYINKSSKRKLSGSKVGNNISINKQESKQASTTKDLKGQDQVVVNGKIKSKSHNKLDRSRKIEISLLFRRRIQRNLIQRDNTPSLDDINETHKLLSKILDNADNDPPFFDIETLKKSKLHKLLKVINSDHQLEEFHPICQEILRQWSNIMTTLKIEKEEQRRMKKTKT